MVHDVSKHSRVTILENGTLFLYSELPFFYRVLPILDTFFSLICFT